MPQSESDQLTPVRRQYLEIKRRYPDAILFFRLGDFYETFGEDARTCARELEITLTSRPIGKNQRVPLAGVPYHAVDGYLARLLARGYKVAVCDQIGEAGPGRGTIERRVTRVVTPGTVVEENLLQTSRNNFLVAVIADDDRCGLATVDASTGQFSVTSLTVDELAGELLRLRPAEILAAGVEPSSIEGISGSVTALEKQSLSVRDAIERLLAHFQSATLEPYGCANMPQAICAAAAVLRYLAETQPAVIPLMTRLSTYSTSDYMTLDPETRRNLELFEPGRGEARGTSLLSTLDCTRTPMGGRLLRQRLGQPLKDAVAVNERLDRVEWFFRRGLLRERLLTALGRIPDLERLLTRLATGRATPRDAVALGRGLLQAQSVAALLHEEPDAPPLAACGLVAETAQTIVDALADDPPANLEAGGVIRGGFSPELDALRRLAGDARGGLAALEQEERERTGVRSLKVGYNRVFGYYIEVSNTHRGELPADYQRRQTLAGAERYTTERLKQYEVQVLNAQEQIAELEATLFRTLCAQVTAAANAIRDLGASLADIDVHACLAEVATTGNYVRPGVDDGDQLRIRHGRHPVVERALPAGVFVPNDTEMSAGEAQIIVLTGPNMAGKSTFLRQVALIVLLAQCGSFVPAEEAQIGIVDRIFTRVGAQDNLAAGSSTFMVEMVESAHILAHATPRSLIILDEVGRGTSTFDGLAIAQAIVEYLHNCRDVAARTLFATHYHELVGLAKVLPRVRNYNIGVSDDGDEVVFLHTILPGGADRSYGVHVAQLAGLPRPVISRARELLGELEAGRNGHATLKPHRSDREPAMQLQLIPPRHPLLDEIAELDVDSFSPFDALQALYHLRKRAREG